MPCAAAAGDAPSERHLEAEDETMNQRLKAALLLAGLIALTALGVGRASPAMAQAPPVSPGELSKTFHCTRSVVPFTVPTGVTHLTVAAHGAQGGTVPDGYGGHGGKGGLTTATLTVTPGQALKVYVGCSAHHGSWGFGNGGGSGNADAYCGQDGWSGGGGSAVTLADGSPLIVAGGGGGGGGDACHANYNGGNGGDGGNPPANGHDGSGPGITTGGRGGGEHDHNGGSGHHSTDINMGGGGGGGGGGHHGGGGGDGGHGGLIDGGGGGGGGGSSWVSPAATGVTYKTGERTGNGLVVLQLSTTPTVTSVSPDYGPAGGGTTVTIAGANFSSDQRFQTENSKPFTDVQCGTPTACTAKTPAVSVAAGKVLQYRVIAVGQTASHDGSPRFTAYGVPTLTHIGPSSGPSEGGTVVWLTGAVYPNGANFPGPVPEVHFGDTPATAVVCSRPDGTVCGVRSPAGTGTVLVTIITPGGTSNALPFTYTGPDTRAMQVSGSASVGGLPAPPGMDVQAWLGSTRCGEGPVALGGSFSLTVRAAAGQPGCGTAGAAVRFTLGGLPAVATPPVLFQPGGQATTTLSAGLPPAASPAPAPPTPTTRCTPWRGPLALIIPWQNCTG